MSGWEGWITFIEDCCKNKSSPHIQPGGNSPATFMFRLGDKDSGKLI